MTKRIELVFDFVSPNACLIWWPLRDLAARHGAELAVIPAYLGGIMKLTGNAPPLVRNAGVKGKNAYVLLEIERFRQAHGLARFRMHPQFPFNSITLQRMLVAAEEDGRAAALIEALLPAIWEEGVDVSDTAAIGAVLAAAGLDAADLAARAGSDPIKQRLAANTDAVVARGAFGIPTMWVGDEMFFGKERLGQIEALLVAF